MSLLIVAKLYQLHHRERNWQPSWSLHRILSVLHVCVVCRSVRLKAHSSCLDRLDGMTGSFEDPIPSDTSSILVPTTEATSTLSQVDVTSMVTVTPSSFITSTRSSTRSTAPPSSSSPSSSSSSAEASQTGSAATTNSLSSYTLIGSLGLMLAVMF